MGPTESPHSVVEEYPKGNRRQQHRRSWELANFLVGTAYVLPLGLIYQKRKNYQAVLWGCLLSVLTMTIAAGVLNYFVFIPAFAWVMGQQVSDFR